MAVDVESLYRAHGPMVLRRCRRLLRDEGKAVDAMHDVFVEILRRRRRWTNVRRPRCCCRAATNVCLNRLRTERRHPEDREETHAGPHRRRAGEATSSRARWPGGCCTGCWAGSRQEARPAGVDRGHRRASPRGRNYPGGGRGRGGAVGVGGPQAAAHVEGAAAGCRALRRERSRMSSEDSQAGAAGIRGIPARLGTGTLRAR